MGTFHQVEQTKEQFADKISGVRVRSVEFGDKNPTEIAIHLSNGETLFVTAEYLVNTEESQLKFSRQVFS